ncbi:PREDICTED: putative pectinesterase 63 [Nelumbo nucifera]|uniref:pectinesterase n=1 Tax=Nelumbo nucifera TaxID=4432 RepID=A0A1U8AJ63_NELNU|nr:PREDICTED: putative pectinesterase 63 [Nelumbo nucifera]
MITMLIVLAPIVFSQDQEPENTSNDPTSFDNWIENSMKTFYERKDQIRQGEDVVLDDALAQAEKSSKVIKVRKDGTGDFKTVADAIASIPSGNKQRIILWIGPGEYAEKITVDKSKPFLTFYGSPENMPILSSHGASASVTVESDYFMAANIIFKNSAPETDGKGGGQGGEAAAMRISGDKAVFYSCNFTGSDKSLYDDKGRHLFKDCYIESTLNFISGNGKSLYMFTEIHSKAKTNALITSSTKEKENEDTGYCFVYCNFTGSGHIYLGQEWRAKGRVIFANADIGLQISPQGSSDGGKTTDEKTIYYAEYNCSGPGSCADKPPPYVRMLSDAEAQPFVSMTYVHGSTWLLPPPIL